MSNYSDQGLITLVAATVLRQGKEAGIGSQWHVEGRGVCRDFAHLAVTLCRCMNIPARYCTGYLGDIGVPPDNSPMDFSAWFEVYLGGRWYTFDARHNKPRIGRILMARGRDATDLAIVTSFGPCTLAGFGWTMLLTYPLMVAIQEISARIGRTTGHGISGNLCRHYPNWLLQLIVTLLFIANTINIAADLSSMPDAARVLFGGRSLLYVFAFTTIGVVASHRVGGLPPGWVWPPPHYAAERQL